MPIITIATTKGGTGKTTIARLLLGHAAQRGYKAGAVDADLNHSLADWAQRRATVPITVMAEVDETKLVPAVMALQEAHDFIVIDTAGASTQATVFAIGCADLVLVPLRMSDADVMEAVKTMKLVESTAMMMGKPIPARAVLSGHRPRTSIAEHVEKHCAAAKLPMLRTKITELVAFPEMTFSGDVPTNGLAGYLVGALFDEVLELTGEKAVRKAS